MHLVAMRRTAPPIHSMQLHRYAASPPLARRMHKGIHRPQGGAADLAARYASR